MSENVINPEDNHNEALGDEGGVNAIQDRPEHDAENAKNPKEGSDWLGGPQNGSETVGDSPKTIERLGDDDSRRLWPDQSAGAARGGTRRLLNPDETKAEAAEAVHRVVSNAASGADVLRFDEPCPAPAGAQLASACRPRGAVLRRPFVVLVVAILRPLPDVAQHVVEAHGVRFEAAHRRGIRVAIATVVDVPCFGIGDLIPRRLVCDIRIRARLVGIFSPEPG